MTDFKSIPGMRPRIKAVILMLGSERSKHTNTQTHKSNIPLSRKQDFFPGIALPLLENKLHVMDRGLSPLLPLSLNKTMRDHQEEIHLIGFSVPSFNRVVVNRGCCVHRRFWHPALGCQYQMMRRKPRFMKHYTFNLISPFETFFK